MRYLGGVVYGAIGGELIAEYTKRQRSKELDPEIRSEARRAAIIDEWDSH